MDGFFTIAVVLIALPWIIFVFLTVGPDLRFYRTAVLEEIKQYGGKVLQTSLSHEDEAKLQAVLDEVADPAS